MRTTFMRQLDLACRARDTRSKTITRNDHACIPEKTILVINVLSDNCSGHGKPQRLFERTLNKRKFCFPILHCQTSKCSSDSLNAWQFVFSYHTIYFFLKHLYPRLVLLPHHIYPHFQSLQCLVKSILNK